MAFSRAYAALFVTFFMVTIMSSFLARAQPSPGGGGDTNEEDLTAFCDESGTQADYSETLSGNDTTTERAVASTTGCPNHVNWEINPNPAREISSGTVVPAYPMLMASDETTDLSTEAGAVGIMLNGVSIFSSWARDQASSYDASAFAIEGDTFDLCGGHATSEGWYHYHSTPGCLQEQAMVVAGTDDSEHSPQIGWSYDGFPVYGQLGPDGVEMLLCNNALADDVYCLDSCSGYEGELDGVDEFKYRYYSSCGFDEAYFPFTTNCYRGCCPTGMTCDSHVEDCDSSAEAGYTADYVPTQATNLAENYESELIEGNDADYIDSDYYVDCSLYLGSAEASIYDDDGSSGGTIRTVPSLIPLSLAAIAIIAAHFTAI